MKNFIPVDKMTKKQKKAYYAQMRGSWEGMNPATRTFPNGRGYDRKKLKQEDKRSGRLSHLHDENICRFSLCLSCFVQPQVT